MEGLKKIFSRGKKSPQEIVTRLGEELKEFEDSLKDPTKKEDKGADTVNQVEKRLAQMKEILLGEDTKGPSKVEDCLSLSLALQESGLIIVLIKTMDNLLFEARKDLSNVFITIVRSDYNNFVNYLILKENNIILKTILEGYGNTNIALNCGSMLRECIKHEELAKIVLSCDQFYNFFTTYVVLESFDVASDAFLTLKDLLQRHVKIVSVFLDPEGPNYIKFFTHYEMLINFDNYVTKRQALKLLGELLLDRINFKIMIAYINDKNNLRLIMNMLRNTSTAIQFEAFHIFKVFVANPKKTIDIATVLYQNQAKIISFLSDFCTDRDDEQFNEEKQLLIVTLRKLKNPSE